jgi:hypothetical protein
MTNPLPDGDQFSTIRAYAKALLCHVASVDSDGRESGLGYEKILDLLKRQFPIVTHKGPHFGQPMHMTYNELYEVVRLLREDGITVPSRPHRLRSDAGTAAPRKPRPRRLRKAARKPGRLAFLAGRSI